jgi:Leucine-rich repeat (LRR) protein
VPNNALEALPDSVGALDHLRMLDLRGNRLAALPDRLGELPCLEKLDLRWNRFLDPPPAAERLAARGCAVLV